MVMHRFAAIIVVMLVNLSCYRAAVIAPVEQATGGKEYSDYGAVWLWGATRTTTRASECTYGVARTQTKFPWWGMLFVMPLTGGLITPIQTHYICAAAPQGLAAGQPTARANPTPTPAQQPTVIVVQSGNGTAQPPAGYYVAQPYSTQAPASEAPAAAASTGYPAASPPQDAPMPMEWVTDPEPTPAATTQPAPPPGPSPEVLCDRFIRELYDPIRARSPKAREKWNACLAAFSNPAMTTFVECLRVRARDGHRLKACSAFFLP
jgi:hypothetical protein